MKSNFKHIVSPLLAVIMVTVMLPTVAFAASGSMKVYVNNEYTGVNNAYLDRHDDVYVESWDDLRKIFPDELEDVLSAQPDDEVLLEDWADEFGYSMSVKNNKVYLYSDGKDSNRDPHLGNGNDESYTSTIRIFRNGMYVSNAAYVNTSSNENVYVNYPQDQNLKTIFGSTPKVMYTYQTLKQYATAMGYKYYRDGNDVFINNDGKTPVVIRVDGTKVNYPDQQPIVVDPGYTMIPIYALGEQLGYTVTWVGGKNQQVDIVNGRHTINLYIGSKWMKYDGQWREMAVAPIVVGDRTLVPARFVVEAFGLNIWYDSSAIAYGGSGVVHIYE